MMKLEKFKEKKNKKKGIIIFTISCILLITGVFLYQSFALFETRENFNFIEGQVQDPGDLYFAYYVEDVLTYEMPSKDSGYTLSSKSSCTNGVTISWDEERWGAFVDYTNYKKENNSRVKCTLYFEEKVIPPSPSEEVKDYIIAKAPEGTLIEDDGTVDHNMRYIGANPSNYVYFNCDDPTNPTADTCELWRIIGVMNNIDDGSGTKETRIKLIRNESIGDFSWDTSDYTVNYGRGINEWSQADAMKLMNPGYDSESVGGSLYWNRGSGTCYNEYGNRTASCDFSLSGMKEEAKKFISFAVWHTGSNGTETTYDKITTTELYDLERSNNICKICSSGTDCNDTVDRTTTWTGYVGLLYPSDYGMATSGSSKTTRTTCTTYDLSQWGTYVDSCKENDWLYNPNQAPWTISPATASNATYVFTLSIKGAVDATYGKWAHPIFPTVYLDSNVKIISGEGSSSSPFILSNG